MSIDEYSEILNDMYNTLGELIRENIDKEVIEKYIIELQKFDNGGFDDEE